MLTARRGARRANGGRRATWHPPGPRPWGGTSADACAQRRTPRHRRRKSIRHRHRWRPAARPARCHGAPAQTEASECTTRRARGAQPQRLRARPAPRARARPAAPRRSHAASCGTRRRAGASCARRREWRQQGRPALRQCIPPSDAVHSLEHWPSLTRALVPGRRPIGARRRERGSLRGRDAEGRLRSRGVGRGARGAAGRLQQRVLRALRR